jgi:hypothetical protein
MSRLAIPLVWVPGAGGTGREGAPTRRERRASSARAPGLEDRRYPYPLSVSGRRRAGRASRVRVRESLGRQEAAVGPGARGRGLWRDRKKSRHRCPMVARKRHRLSSRSAGELLQRD